MKHWISFSTRYYCKNYWQTTNLQQFTVDKATDNLTTANSHLQHQQKILWETKNLEVSKQKSNAIKPCRGILTTIRTNSIGLQLQFAVCSCFWPSKSCPTNIWFRVDLYKNAITVRTAKQQKQLELLYCVYVYEW